MMTETNTMQTIALVDDDRNILTSVSIALEAEGYKVETYTCLLYTSPSPRDKRQSRMPSSA